MLSDLPEPVARGWYLQTLAAADSLAGLGRASSWSRRPVSAASMIARRRVAAYLRRAAAGVKAGRIKAREFRRLRAFLLGSLDAAGTAGGGGAAAGDGGAPGGVDPSSVVMNPSGAVNVPTSAANAAGAALQAPIGGGLNPD